MQQDEQATVGKLVLSAGNRMLREVVIDRRQLTVGRRPYNDLLLDDLTVSGEHAIVHTEGTESVIHDLKSRNGTLINGAPVTQQQLADGDCVDIGIYRLVYKVERLEASRSRDGFRAAFMPPTQYPLPTNLAGARTSAWLPSARAHPAGHDGSTNPISPANSGNPINPVNPIKPPHPEFAAYARPDDLRPASLRFLGGHDAGRQMPLQRPIVSIRNGSGQVAVVAKRQKGYFLTHVEGPSYPLVNGESIGLSAHVLRDNDLIELAGTIIQFSLDH